MAVNQDISPGRQLLPLIAWREIASALKLSPRELSIVQAVFDDQPEWRIAQDLGISSHTVHTHMERLYHKLGIAGRVPLVVRVLAEYLTECPLSGRQLHSRLCHFANRAKIARHRSGSTNDPQTVFANSTCREEGEMVEQTSSKERALKLYEAWVRDRQRRPSLKCADTKNDMDKLGLYNFDHQLAEPRKRQLGQLKEVGGEISAADKVALLVMQEFPALEISSLLHRLSGQLSKDRDARFFSPENLNANCGCGCG